MLLERGAESVLALDVGHGQMDALLEKDPRVTLREGVNVRALEPPPEEGRVGLIVADLSFISLVLVVEPLVSWLDPGGDAILLVKPQFEVGVDRLGRSGVVRDVNARMTAVATVAKAAISVGLGILDVARSVVSGVDGNVEFFVWGHKSWQAGDGEATSGRPHPLDAEALQAAIVREVGESA